MTEPAAPSPPAAGIGFVNGSLGRTGINHRMAYLNGTFAKALEHASTRWLEWFRGSLARRGSTPKAQLLGIWDALEEWFESDHFYGSTITNAAAKLQDHPQHPGHQIIAAHRRALRQLLEELTVSPPSPASGATSPRWHWAGRRPEPARQMLIPDVFEGLGRCPRPSTTVPAS